MRNISSLLIALILLTLAGCAGLGRYAQSNEKPPFTVTNVRDLTQKNIKDLSNKLDTSEVYIVVHPSYYIFFHEKDEQIMTDASKTAVETFIETEYNDVSPARHLMKEYEKAEMQFISSANIQKKVVILLTPGNYTSSPQYLFKDGPDPYAQYINSLTRNSESIFYIESWSVSSGKMFQEDQAALLNFLSGIGAKKIYIGGGYVGRCQNDVYNFLAQTWSRDDIAIISEISAFSPDDVSDPTAKMLLTAKMKLNSAAVNSFIINGGIRNLQTNKPNVVNIPDSD